MLKKIDCVLENLDFYDLLVGSNILFQPYRISDHSPAILRIARISNFKPNMLPENPDHFDLNLIKDIKTRKKGVHSRLVILLA